MSSTYQHDVIDPGDRASALAASVNQRSYENNGALEVLGDESGTFRGLVRHPWRAHVLKAMERGDVYPVTQNDGAGSKPLFFAMRGTADAFRGLADEIIAMCADDIAAKGGLPVAMISNELQLNQITDENFPLIKALFEGFEAALKRAGLASITGEVAVMKYALTSPFATGSREELLTSWGGTCQGLARTDRMFEPDTIRAGMPIVGFAEHGYRCNGGSRLIELIEECWGTPAGQAKVLNAPVTSLRYFEKPELQGFLELITKPSISYARTLARLNGWSELGEAQTKHADIRGVAHITGGGVWGKLPEVLPDGLGADLAWMPEPPKVLARAQELSHRTTEPLTDHEMYGTFNGGCGMLLVCASKQDAAAVISEAGKDGIDAKVVGAVSGTNEITIQSRFESGQMLSQTAHA